MKLIISGLFIVSLVCHCLANAEEERIQLKQGVTRSKTLATPMGVIVYQESEEKNLMPGNDSFGFFYKSGDSKNGFCRIKMKVVCDYGLEILKEQKNIEAQIKFTNVYYKARTDTEGVLDIIFRCDSARKDDGVIITLKKFMHASKLSEIPPELRIPEGDCK